MKLADALKRIEQLEAKVRELEARPVQHIHHHHPQPVYPLPYNPCNPWPNITYAQNWGAAQAPLSIDPAKSMIWRNPAPDAACGGVPTGTLWSLTIDAKTTGTLT